MKSKEEIQTIQDREQCYFFVVKSLKRDFYRERETVQELMSYSVQDQIEIASQIAKLIMISGLGDVGFHNLLIDRETKKLVFVDTEPLYGSLLLEEGEIDKCRYNRTNEFHSFTNNYDCVMLGFRKMIESCKTLPIFQEVLTIYQTVFQETFEKK